MAGIRLIRGDREMPPPFSARAISVGAFDGLHLGHQAILQRLQKQAAHGLQPTVVLFEPLPRVFFSERAVPRLQTFRDKILGLEALGVKCIVCLRFNQELANTSAEEFISGVLIRKLGMRAMVVGEDFRFGRRRLGDVELLMKLANKHGFTLESINIKTKDQERISSTRIRATLAGGDMEKVFRWLGRPYSFSAKVGYGKQRGAALGFPTANLFCGRHSPPLAGVYAAEASWKNSQQKSWRCVLNAGTQPTFDGRHYRIEAHIPGYHGTLYGQRLRLSLRSRIRGECRFRNADELRKKIKQDLEAALSFSPSHRQTEECGGKT